MLIREIRVSKRKDTDQRTHYVCSSSPDVATPGLPFVGRIDERETGDSGRRWDNHRHLRVVDPAGAPGEIPHETKAAVRPFHRHHFSG
jgi:hypothetical protein